MQDRLYMPNQELQPSAEAYRLSPDLITHQ